MIRDILLLQKRELEKRLEEKYVPRDVSLKGIDSDLIKVITGPRRAGKSFYAVHTLKMKGSFGYANFDDEKLVEVKDYEGIMSAIDSIYDNPEHVLFDEIQNLPKWELFVNRLQRQGYNLIITGSNSNLLSRELSTHLTGRHLVVNVFPFSFKESLRLENRELTENEIRGKLAHYLSYGGYPEPMVKGIEYKDYLSTLFNSVVYKDIIKRYRIRAVQGMEDLASYFITNTAREFSHNSLTRITKCRSIHTVEKYLGHLEESFLLFRVNRFSYKLKEQMSSNKKIYCIDNGFIYSKAFKLSPDMGRLCENVVAIELKKRELSGDAKIYYWKNPQQEEVDFVVKKGVKIEKLIQVCYETGDSKTCDREVRALLKAGRELKCNNLEIITWDAEKEEERKWFGIKKKIKYTPLWKWLLE